MKRLVALLVCVLMLTSPAYAGISCPKIKLPDIKLPNISFEISPVDNGFKASPWTEEAAYQDKVLGKLKFGVENALFGWAEVLQETQEGTQREEMLDLPAGVCVGLFNAIVDTVGGVLHVATAPIPLDIPLPEGGTDINEVEEAAAA